MTSTRYAAKARTFKISRPNDEASDGQLRQIDRLLTRLGDAVPVALGNDAIELVNDPTTTRGEADSLIKNLAEVNVKNVVNQVIATHKAAAQPTVADIGQMVLDGKLGKVAAKKAHSLVG